MADDYPKIIYVGGINVTVRDAEEEAFWTQPIPAPAPPADPEPNVPAEAVEEKPKTKKKK